MKRMRNKSYSGSFGLRDQGCFCLWICLFRKYGNLNEIKKGNLVIMNGS